MYQYKKLKLINGKLKQVNTKTSGFTILESIFRDRLYINKYKLIKNN